jgi:hypothetical protein
MVVILGLVGLVLAFAIGIWVGLGLPGTAGREDRVVSPGKARREAEHRPLDWLRGPRR